MLCWAIFLNLDLALVALASSEAGEAREQHSEVRLVVPGRRDRCSPQAKPSEPISQVSVVSLEDQGSAHLDISDPRRPGSSRARPASSPHIPAAPVFV